MQMLDATKIPFDVSNWPQGIATIAPHIWIALLVTILIVSAFFIGLVAKRLVRHLGRKAYPTQDLFIGSSWDLAAPVVQLLVFLMAVTGGAELFGFNFSPQLFSVWPKAFAGIVIIAGAVLLATWINQSLRAYSERAHARLKIDDTLISFMTSIIRYAILGIAVLMAVSQFGVAPGSLIAIVGAAGLAVALALQDTLKAVAAGFMIAMFRPFRLGDWAQIGGHEGEVYEITPFTTSIKQGDNKTVQLTNDKVWGDAIVNHTKQGQRRLDLYFGVHYDTNLDHALDVLSEIAVTHERTLRKQETWTGVHSLDDWAITLRLRVWVKATDFLQVRADITKSVKQSFDKVGIEIPYPHQVEMVRDIFDPNSENKPFEDTPSKD